MNDARRFGNTIKRLPIVFCLDVSPSMGWDIDNRDIIPMELLNNSVNTFIREMNSDGRTRSSAEVSYVTFSTDIEVDSPFIPARNLDNIHLRPVSEGGTNMAQAVLRSYQKLEERVNEYVRSGIRFNVPFFVLVAADGWRALRECWKLALGASIAFVVPWCLAARFTGCELPDIVGGITVMTLFAFLGKRGETNVRRQLWAWMPFGFVVVALGAVSMMPPEWKPSPGIVVLSAGALGGLCQGVGPLRLLGVAAKTAKRYALAVLTICTVLALAKTMVAAGLTRNLAEGLVAATGGGYAAVSGIVGALGGFVTGSGTSTNVLFGALQASVGSSDAERLLFAAANVMGAGIGKMVCPQSIVLGCAAAGLAGRESEVMKRAFPFFVAVLSLACAVTFTFKLFDIIGRTLQ